MTRWCITHPDTHSFGCSIDYVMEIMWHNEAQLEQSASVHAAVHMKSHSVSLRVGAQQHSGAALQCGTAAC